MANWVLKGLRTGIRSSRYPAAHDPAEGLSPGRPVGTRLSPQAAADLVARCPTAAIARHADGAAILEDKCVHCFRCHPDAGPPAATWEAGHEWAAKSGDGVAREMRRLAGIFGRSLHIRFVDAGACGACISEARQLTNPYYNLHRLGLFITPTPRNADVLLVAGPVSDAMRTPLRQTWEAVPPPKRVVGVGACAISGGVFGPSFAAGGGVAHVIPVDVVVPGCPPPPVAILHALLVVVGKKPPRQLASLPPAGEAAA
jgi:Ni,Fe-hydrogenase III small subunit